MKQSVVKIQGGLDLVTDPLTANPGFANLCENYEVAVRDGIRRIAGFSRWDGRYNWSNTAVAISVLSTAADGSPTGWTLGQAITITYASIVDGSDQTTAATVVAVSDEDQGGGSYLHSATMVLNYYPDDWPFSAYNLISAFTGAPTGPYQVSSVYLTGNGYTYYAANVTALPGGTYTRVPGLHWFNDKLYAIVDLVAVLVEPANGFDSIVEGAKVYNGIDLGLIGTIASVSAPNAAEYLTVELLDYYWPGASTLAGLYTAVSAESVADGAFDTGTGWTPGAGWAITGGKAVATAAAANLVHTFTPTASTSYRVTLDAVVTTGTAVLRLGNIGFSINATGTYTQIVTTTTTQSLRIIPSTFTGTIDNVSVIEVEAGATYIGETQPTRAAMYSADWNSAGGWTRIDLGRIMAFKETSATSATAFFLPYNRRGFIGQFDVPEITDTGWIGAATWEEIPAGGAAWTGVGATDLQAQDGTTVGSATGPWTNWIKANFSGVTIPGGALVTAVQIRIYRNQGGPNNVFDSTVALGKDAIQGANHASIEAWPAIAAWKEYGSATANSWGFPISPDEVNDGSLFAYLRCSQQTGTNGVVDSIAIKVYYQPQTRKAYVYDSTQTPTDQEIDVVHYAVSKGNATDNDREGVVVLNPSKTVGNALKAWQFAPGQQIRTQSGGAGALLAEVSSIDRPVTLPSSYTVAAEPARYAFCSANPYAADLLDVLFIASGVENAYMFDGQYALPIRTGLIDTYEKPRHVTWARTFLALGYRSGSVSLSDTGDPLVYVSTSSVAAEVGQGARITGLVAMKGESLGVFTESSISTLKGASPASLTVNLISASSGAIEYTVVDMGGQVMFCDRHGVSTITNTDQYGDFNVGRMTWRGAPWLMRRLQRNIRDTDIDIGILCAYAKKDSNQYRILFKDGWQASLTLPATDGQEPQLTTQHFYGDVTDRDGTGIKFLAIATGAVSDGRDVAFSSFDFDPTSSRYRYVFQMDTGRGFDGVDIYAYWESQPLILGAPFHGKFLDQIGLVGIAYGYAALTVYVAADFTSPDVAAATPHSRSMSFGDGTSYAAATESRFRYIKSIGAEGEDFTIGIESQTQEELPHTIQSVVVRYKQEEPKA